MALNCTFIEYYKTIYVVVGIGYDANIDPPDVFYCVALDKDFYHAVIQHDVVKIPVGQCLEITDEKRIRTLWILYGK